MNGSKVVIITDLGTPDIDDVLALLLACRFHVESPHLTVSMIVVTGHLIDKRVLMVLGLLKRMDLLGKIPVVKGPGIPYSETYSPQLREDFRSENLGFPFSVFGYPQGTHDPQNEGERLNYPDFGKAFQPLVDELTPEEKQEGLADDAQQRFLELFGTGEMIRVISLAPMHFLAAVPLKYYPQMQIIAMGGGFGSEKEFEASKNTGPLVHRLGYNWGIAPDVTRLVLRKCQDACMPILVISSSFVRDNGFELKESEYNRIFDPEAPIRPDMRFVLEEWTNCNKASRTASKCKLLCDPLTLFIVFKPQSNCVRPVHMKVTRPYGGSYLTLESAPMLVGYEPNDTDLPVNTMLISKLQGDHEPIRTEMVGLIMESLLLESRG